jgi:predicted nucleic acid-binding protein
MARGHTHYLDASALVKLVIAEEHSEKLRAHCGRALLATTSLCFGEALGVLKGKWEYKRLTSEAYLAACEDLFARVRNDSLEIEDTPLFSAHSRESRATYEEIETLARKHSLDISDALQLHTLRSGTYSRLERTAEASLVTADSKLARAAKAEGMRAWDCVHEPATFRSFHAHLPRSCPCH